MIASLHNPCSMSAADWLHKEFLSILPRITTHARIATRDIPCPHKREDCIAETIALCWAWYRRLMEAGKDVHTFVSALATYAARAVRSGRGVCGQQPIVEVLSARAQQRHEFVVMTLPNGSSRSGNVYEEALQDNRQAPVPEQVCFRLDFPVWMQRLTQRDQRMVEDLMVGERTYQVADKFGVSHGRISQKRREFYLDWLRFNGDELALAEPAAAIA